MFEARQLFTRRSRTLPILPLLEECTEACALVERRPSNEADTSRRPHLVCLSPPVRPVTPS